MCDGVMVMSELAFTVPGEPVPKARPRARVVGPFARIYTPGTTRKYEGHVRVIAREAAQRAHWAWGAKDRFEVELAVFRIHELRGGDLDNLAKSILDPLNGIAYPDDRRVLRLQATLAVDRENPRVEVIVRKVPCATTTRGQPRSSPRSGRPRTNGAPGRTLPLFHEDPRRRRSTAFDVDGFVAMEDR